MRQLKPLLFVSVIAISLGSTPLTGQRSLYQDALALREYVAHNEVIPELKVTIKHLDGVPTNVQVFSLYYQEGSGAVDTVDISANLNDFEFPKGQPFSLYFSNFSIHDSIVVRFGHGEETFSPQEYYRRVLTDLEPDEFVESEVPAFSLYFDPDAIEVEKEGWSGTIVNSMTVSFYLNGYAVISNAPSFSVASYDQSTLDEFVLRLEQHAKLTEGNIFYLLDEFELKQAYADNPFINIEELLPELRLFKTYEPQVWRASYADFPYQRVLYGDSSLVDNTLAIGVDEFSSYRQRIVTAQNRLEQANDAFERQRKKGGLLDANTVAVGLSDFIAERAQEELNLTFFNRFKENLAKESELTVLFPTTRDLLNKFEISNYKVFLAHAKERFKADLDNLGVNLSGILNLPRYQQFKNDPNVFNLALIYDIANAAYEEKTVEEIILTTHQELVEREINLSESINLAIADSLFSKVTSPGSPDVLTFAFQQHIQTYLEEVRRVSLSLNNTCAAFREPTGYPLFSIFQDNATTVEDLLSTIRNGYRLSEEDRAEMQKIVDDEELRFEAERLNQLLFKLANAGGYNGAYAHGDPGQKTEVVHHGEYVGGSYVDHSLAVIPAYLEGHDYYGYYLEENPVLQRMGLKNIPLEEPNGYVAKGLERARNFLDIPFDKLTLNHYQEIVRSKLELEAAQRKAEDDINEIFEVSVKGALKIAQAGLLRQMEAELTALQRAIDKQPNTDRYLVELELLRQELVAKSTGGDDELYVGEDYHYYVTKTSMVDGANRILDTYQLEWEQTINAAIDFHGKRVSAVGRVELNPAYSAPEVPDYHTYPYTEDLRDTIPYFKFSPDNPARLTVAEVLAPHLKQAMPDYQEAREFINGLKTEKTLGFERIDELLNNNEQEIIALGQRRKALIEQLDSLENAAASKLVKSRRNAKELAKAIEISAHILFAFRDYRQIYDTLYYLDTQRVEITVQNTDINTGLVHTFKKDSSLVVRTPVPSTTDPIPVAKWITRKQFDELRRDPQTWDIFLGLLYQRLNAIEGSPSFSPRAVATLATQFLTVANEIQESQDKLRFKKGTNPDQVGLKEYFPFIRSTVDLLNIVLTTPITGDSTVVSERARALGRITQISNETLSLYENIEVGEYGNAILNATDLLRIITSREDTQEALDAMTKEERRRRKRNQQQVAAIFKYGTFMAEMINAQSSEQVQTILKSTTLPPGSSRIKREVVSNFTINSYLGAGVGRDRLLDAPTGITPDAFGAALSVPIGMTYSFSPSFLNNNSSFSIHVPLLDLGAITAYRSNPNGATANVNALPELEWKNLFSPGAYLVYNFANSPFSVGVGGQYGPQLRQLEPANGEPLFLNSWRFPMLFLSIDVPFYNLFTGPRKIVVD